MDFTCYIAFEAQALARMATLLQLPQRADYWSQLARNTTAAMNELMWHDESGFFFEQIRFFQFRDEAFPLVRWEEGLEKVSSMKKCGNA